MFPARLQFRKGHTQRLPEQSGGQVPQKHGSGGKAGCCEPRGLACGAPDVSLRAAVRLWVEQWPLSVLSDCARWALYSRRCQGEQVEEPVCLYPPVLKDKGPPAWASMLSTPIFWPRMLDPFACLPRVPYF